VIGFLYQRDQFACVGNIAEGTMMTGLKGTAMKIASAIELEISDNSYIKNAKYTI